MNVSWDRKRRNFTAPRGLKALKPDHQIRTRHEQGVTRLRVVCATILLLAVAALTGCGHKLVAHNGNTTVNVYDNKEQFDKVQGMKSQGGAAGIFGGIGESMLAKKVDNNTPIKILWTDSEGAMIEVTAGPNKGLEGYVPKDNVD